MKTKSYFGKIMFYLGRKKPLILLILSTGSTQSIQ